MSKVERRTPSDETASLVLRGQRGDRDALTSLITLYQGRVARFVIKHTGDDCHYEDLCQAIFVRMILALPRLRSVDRFEPWLFQIARNACRDELRRQRHRRMLFVPQETGHDVVSAPPSEPEDEAQETLDAGMGRMPETQRRLLELRLVERKTYEELARLLNLSVSAVKSRLHRARETLRRILLPGEAE